VCKSHERAGTLKERGECVDYLTFVPDGEPTLDTHLSEEIDRLRSVGIPIAVISNGSLAWNSNVRAGRSSVSPNGSREWNS
jgi:wyosine [tRNA(Phe)-imidazoG37] synthetase (radical SAM superfamily)